MADIVTRIMEWEDGEMTHAESVAFFQELVDNGMAWRLQGTYGRTAAYFLQRGWIAPTTETAMQVKRDGLPS